MSTMAGLGCVVALLMMVTGSLAQSNIVSCNPTGTPSGGVYGSNCTAASINSIGNTLTVATTTAAPYFTQGGQVSVNGNSFAPAAGGFAVVTNTTILPTISTTITIRNIPAATLTAGGTLYMVVAVGPTKNALPVIYNTSTGGSTTTINGVTTTTDTYALTTFNSITGTLASNPGTVPAFTTLKAAAGPLAIYSFTIPAGGGLSSNNEYTSGTTVSTSINGATGTYALTFTPTPATADTTTFTPTRPTSLYQNYFNFAYYSYAYTTNLNGASVTVTTSGGGASFVATSAPAPPPPPPSGTPVAASPGTVSSPPPPPPKLAGARVRVAAATLATCVLVSALVMAAF